MFRSQLLDQSALAPDLNSRFESDWSKAQKQYQAGVNAGFDESDADAIYLQPVRSKWKIIQASPQLVKDKDQLDNFHNEYDRATENFQKNLNSYSRDNGQWAANREGSLNPLFDKWTLESALPASATPKNNANFGNFKAELAARNKSDYFGIKSDASALKLAEAEAKKNSPEALMNERIALQSKLDNDKLPPDILATLGAKAASLDAQRTNSVPEVQPYQNDRWSYMPEAVDSEVVKSAQNQLPDFTGKPVGESKYKTKYQDVNEVKSAFKSKELTRDEALKILKDQFGLE